ncbi:Pentatricopeptide repeat-containing protein, chloroplastic [Glycine soja]
MAQPYPLCPSPSASSFSFHSRIPFFTIVPSHSKTLLHAPRFSLQPVNTLQDAKLDDPDAKSPSLSKNSIWVNPRSPRAKHLQKNSPHARSSSLTKLAKSLDSCNPTEQHVSEILNVLRDNVSERDAVFILNTMVNPNTALLALKYFQPKINPAKHVVLYNVTLKVLREVKDFEGAEKLFDEMLQRGVEPNLITFSTIISSASVCSLPDKAIKWFEKMPSFGVEPDASVGSFMIHAYAHSGKADMALELYDRAKAEKWRVDTVAFSVLIKMCGMLENFDGCLSVYNDMKVLGAKPNMVTYNTLLYAMGRAKRALDAKAIYEEMISNGFSPNWPTHAALLQAYCKARFCEDALGVYKEMKKKGMDVNLFLYNLLFDMCADVGCMDEAVEIFEDMKSSGTCQPDNFTYSCLINMYSSHLKRTDSLESSNPWEQQLFDEMLQRGVKPDNITFSTLVNCASVSGLPNKAVELFEKMSGFGCEPDGITCSGMVYAYARTNNVDKAVNLYDRAKAENWSLDAVTFSTLIKMYSMAGNYDKCLEVYQEMKVLGVKPNVATYNTLLGAMLRSKKHRQAKAIHKEMKSNGVSPDFITYASLLEVYTRAQCSEDALGVYKEMKGNGMDMTADLYNKLLAMCADVGYTDRAVEIFYEMKSSGTCQPDSWTFSSLITIYSRSGKVSEVEGMLNEMIQSGFQPTIFVMTSLIRCYGKAKRTDDVVKIFKQLLDLGIVPNDHFCCCLLNVLTQTPKEELGKLTDCIEKANTKLGTVVRYLVEEQESDEGFRKETLELLNSIDAEVKKPLCNCLIDLCVKLNVPERACGLLDLGLMLEIYKNIQSKSQTQWSLHLKELSVGAAMTALHVWINDLSEALESGEDLPPLLGINTGQGKHKYSDKGLASVFESRLKEINAPFHEAKAGWFLVTKAAAKLWLESRDSSESIAGLNFLSFLLCCSSSSFPPHPPSSSSFHYRQKITNANSVPSYSSRHFKLPNFSSSHQPKTLLQDAKLDDPNAKSSPLSKTSIWVNPKSPRAKHLWKNSYHARSSSLTKLAKSLDSCNPTQEHVSEILKVLGDSVLEPDAVFILNSMVNPYTALLAVEYFKQKVKSVRHVILYNVTLKLFRKVKDFEGAEKLFDEMLHRGVNPNLITFSTMISCASVCSLPHKAVKWFEMMPSFGCEPDNNVCSSMIYAYTRTGNTDMALRLYDRAKAGKWHVDTAVFSGLIKMYGVSGNYVGCLNVYNDMKVLGAKPNLTTYNALLYAMGRAKRARDAKAIYGEMISNGLSPNWPTYAALLQAYCRARFNRDALNVYKEMNEKGKDLDILLYNMLFDMCANVGCVDEAVKIFEHMKSSGTCPPDSFTYASLINMYSSIGKILEMEAMFNEMMESGFEPNIIVLTSLVHCYGKAKRTDDVVKIFNQLMDLGISPDGRFCDCLLYAMTQVPKEELGKLSGCVEKANPKLGSVLRYIMEKQEGGGDFRTEASELFNSTEADVKKSMCNCLIDLCVSLDVPDRARDLLDLGLTLEIYPDIQSRSQAKWSLHLKRLSVGAALTALSVWISDLSKALELGEELPPLLGINTGGGKHRFSDKVLPTVFESYLKELKAPFHKDANKAGWFLATSEAATSWLQSRGSTVALPL